MKQEDLVTIVVVPRDHFSDTLRSLESIFANADIPFALVYVDGGSPRHVAEYLREEAARNKFHLIRTEHFLSPNHARNLGARVVETKYIVFIDNDVIVAPGWLGPLVRTAEKTGAGIVGPMTFENEPLHTISHFSGGEAHIETVTANGNTERHIVDRIFKRVPPSDLPTECAEFHCMLVRTEAFRAVGGLDERMLSTRENLDFCMAMRGAGYEIRTEPSAKVTYLPPIGMHLSDIPYFSLRWSDEWDKSSFNHFIAKWDLTVDNYFKREFRNLGWRRQGLMMREGLLRWLPSRVRVRVERLLRPLERALNRRISRNYEKSAALRQQN